MTKPANFPGRKNIRRASALRRIQQSKPYADQDRDVAQTMGAIIPQEQAEGVRTKKDRSNKARIS